jgi:hypothetical protein
MANDYITLRTSNYNAGPPVVGLQKRFKAIEMRHANRKAEDIKETINGGLDGSFGGIYKSMNYAIRCSETLGGGVSDVWGTLADLYSFFELNNPSGTPSNTITLIDHYGATHSVWYRGEHTPEPMTTIIEGQYAHYIIQTEFQVIPS